MKSYSCGQYSDIRVQAPSGLEAWGLSPVLCPSPVISTLALEPELMLAIPLLLCALEAGQCWGLLFLTHLFVFYLLALSLFPAEINPQPRPSPFLP